MSLSSMSDIAMPRDAGTFPFVIACVRGPDSTSKMILRAGPDMTQAKVYRELEDAGLSGNSVGDGRIKHDNDKKTIIVYSMPGPTHKLTFEILKTAYPDYSSIIWRDG